MEIVSEMYVVMLCNNPEIMEYRTELVHVWYKPSPEL